jgi:hypothetical protein
MTSNIIIQDHEVDLDDWLKQKKLTILVHQSNTGWQATFNVFFSVEGAPAGPVGGSDALTAVRHFVNGLFGARLSTNLPGEIVPRFNQESIAKAVARAGHTAPKNSVPE